MAMIRSGFLVLIVLFAGASHASGQASDFVALFDGRSLNGWDEASAAFRVVDGAIVGGTLEAPIPQNEYLCTTEEFDDFELRLSALIKGRENAGVHFRSQRISDSSEVAGYQADMGFIAGELLSRVSDAVPTDTVRPYPLWGSLLDEFRQDASRYSDSIGPFWLLAVADRAVVEGVLLRDDWNDVAITAVGTRIEIRLNGVTTVEFTEEGQVPESGLVCLQLHEGAASEAWYRDISIRNISALPVR